MCFLLNLSLAHGVSLVIIEPVAEQSQKERIHKQANKKWVFKIYIYIECIKLNKPTS